ncbi:hypothetical protein DBR32_07580 [Taibaiella sp. KBW10]|uniref:T9SS type B sorting domain-containing protein n=1 Tax=Taibaiella sp. KBW10 TaxID=2153357 RepID=UPI000F5A4257|nr:gliding motility-associated C-terminal domain-containing protein [Taibaiella sp. KBW10]RQO31794.1 hypothetical protein DBR32_07580 [Taibaiella sp. KBW10]
MNRKLQLLLTILSLGCFIPKAEAQLETPLFSFNYDTICLGSEFTPNVLVNDAKTYNWSFCPPLLGGTPAATSMGIGNYQINVNSCITTLKVDTFYYSFTASQDGKVFRYQYEDGIEQAPIVTDLGHYQDRVPDNPTGISTLKDASGWHVFVIGSAVSGGPRFVRIDFANGLNYAPTGFVAYNTTAFLTQPRELFTVIENDSIRAFTFNNGNALSRIDLKANIDSIQGFTNFGNISNAFSGVSGLANMTELGNHHFIVTNETTSKLSQVTFGNSYLNVPFAVDMGSLSGKLKVPTGIAIVKNCNDYYGYVTNKNTGEWVSLYWPASIAGVPTASVATMNTLLLPTSLSNAVRDSNGVYMHVINSDNTLLRVKYGNCTNASISGSDKRVPNPVKYNRTGTYSVFLTVDEGLATERHFCKPIYVKDHPSYNLTVQDTLICSGDTINMHVLTFGTDSFVWSPNYNIDTLAGRFVRVWPQYSTLYTVAIDYAPNCIVKETFNVRVDNIKSDAGEDRVITDGSITQIGGPQTTVRPTYTYKWTPNVFFESTLNEPIARVKPAQNMTYYLTVTAPSGCTAIDSVKIGVPCEDIRLPNAFAPKDNSFGLLNLQLTQVNYFRIFDRWGREVFSTTNPNVKWTGRDMQGVECMMGVYVWEIDAYCKDTNQRFRKSGNVTLIR